VHPDAVFIIIVVACLAVAATIIITILRRHAREEPDKASPTPSSEQ